MLWIRSLGLVAKKALVSVKIPGFKALAAFMQLWAISVPSKGTDGNIFVKAF